MIVSANFAEVSLAQYDTLLDNACFCFHFLLSDHHANVVAPLNRRLSCFPEDFWELLRGVKQKVIGGRVFSYWLPQRRYFDALPVYQVWKKKLIGSDSAVLRVTWFVPSITVQSKL